MKLKCLGSSSKGNCYILQGRKQNLIIEAGVPFTDIRRSINSFGSVAGCIISHRHGDHTKSVEELLYSNVDVYAGQDVWEHICDSVTVYGKKHELESFYEFSVGEFSVTAFPAIHDVECYSFLIQHKEMGKLLFITDSMRCEHAFPDVRHIMIECNHNDELLAEAIEDGRTSAWLANRVRQTHMNIDETTYYLTFVQDIAPVSEVVLLHLSHEHSDADLFRNKVSEVTGKEVYVAEPGFQLDLKSATNGNRSRIKG